MRRYRDDGIKIKRYGQVFSGKRVGELLVSMLPKNMTVKSIIDPMVGRGDLLWAAYAKYPQADVVLGVDVDEDVREKCKNAIPEAEILIKDVFKSNEVEIKDGWDLVITNPPYIRYQTLKRNPEIGLPDGKELREGLINHIQNTKLLDDQERQLYFEISKSYSGLSDMAVPSWILCASIVKKGGYMAMVVPETWLNRDYAMPIHYVLLRCFEIVAIARDVESAWFENAEIRTCLVICKRKENEPIESNYSDTVFLELKSGITNQESLVGNMNYKGSIGYEAVNHIIYTKTICSSEDFSSRIVPAVELFPGFIGKINEQKWIYEEDKVQVEDSTLLPNEIRSIVSKCNDVEYDSLEDLGWTVGQGLRTGANEFFYAQLLSEDAVNIVQTEPWYGRRIALSSHNVRKAFKKRSDINGLVVDYDDLNKCVFYIQNQVRQMDYHRLTEKAAEHYTLMESDLDDYITQGEKYISPSHKKSFRELSAVITNEKKIDDKYERFWYMQGRNGIWYFILNNSYKPGLVTNQFNCIVSNPPWLAMSKLADNPYKKALQRKTESFGIKPPGASHLHMELATTFLLASIDKYLKDGARWMCVMPGSILSGYHHDPLRLEKYRDSAYSVDTNVDTIWELPITTFKNKAVVLGGIKTEEKSEYPIIGRVYDEPDLYVECNYTLNKQGNRSAWTNKGENAEFLDVINSNPWEFNQGADIMPRTALFHDFTKQPNGTWSIKKIDKTSELYYLLSDSHKDVCRDLVAEGFSDDYMYDCLISKHLSPFFVARSAKVIVPEKNIDGRWKGLTDDEIALLNPGTSYVFNEIQTESEMPLSVLLEQRINIRNKMDKQNYSLARWLVLSNAGGTNPCAAYVDLNSLDKKKLIIDQTLYWYLAESEEEALYIVGILNSVTLSAAISDFQPQGGFGARHIHTIPYKIIPRFDANNDAHIEVVSGTRSLITEWTGFCNSDKVGKYLLPNSGSLNSRRRKLQTALRAMTSYGKYEEACGSILCTE